MARASSMGAIAGLLVIVSSSVVFAQTVKRTVLQQRDLSVAGHEVITARAEFPAGGSTGPHTHPGDEVSYVLEGTVAVVVDGVTATYKVGEAFHVPAGKVHDAKAVGGAAVVIASFVVEKGKPVTSAVTK
jgi:quercetin dioxygenase-like cupin family protein